MSIQLGLGQVVDIGQVEATQRKIGEVFRRNRRVLDITQADLSARTGLPQSLISKLEHEGRFSFDVFYRTSCGLHVPAWKLLKKAQDPEVFEGAEPIRSLIIE